jgi:hypothetical protein
MFHLLVVPDAIGQWLFPHTWQASWTTGLTWRTTLVIFLFLVVFEICLISLTPLSYRLAASTIAKEKKIDINSAYLMVRQRRDIRRSVKKRSVSNVIARLIGYGFLNFALGATTAIFAWGIAVICDKLHNGILQILIVCLVIFLAWLIGFIFTSVHEQLVEDKLEEGGFDLFPNL